jgi:hypothetical protein
MLKRAAIALCAALVLIVPASAHGATTSGAQIPKNNPGSAQLVEHPKAYDGLTVTFTGEAIGEVMRRDSYAWIHLNDDAYEFKNVEEGAKLGGYNSGMAVYVPAELTSKIDSYGDYKHEGSIVQISGTFNAACKEHGGDMDIHATSLDVLIPGHVVVDPVRPWKVWLALVLVALAGALWFIERSTRNRVAPHRGV